MKAKVLKTEKDYASALRHLERLMTGPEGKADELELWAVLIEKYEEDHFPVAAPDPVDAIRFRMEQSSLSASDLTPYLQSKSKVSEVLNRKRPLSRAMIRSLYAGLKIPAAVLVQEPQAPYLSGKPSSRRKGKR